LTKKGHPGRLDPDFSGLGVAERTGDPTTPTNELITVIIIIIIIIIIIFINCNWVVTL